MQRAIIVASGPSAAGFVPPDDVPVIAVNGAIDWLHRADYWFSLDASIENRLRLSRKRLKNCEYHVAARNPLRWKQDRLDHNWYRIDSLGTYIEPRPVGSPHWWLWRLGAVLGICKQANSIHTGNSAWGALGLAWHLGFRDVALIGVDANDRPRVEGGQPGVLSHLPLLFDSAAADIRVVCCGDMVGKGFVTKPFGAWYEDR